MNPVPEIILSPAERAILGEASQAPGGLELLEAALLRDDEMASRLASSLRDLRSRMLEAWRARAHLVVRGGPTAPEEGGALLVSSVLFSRPKPYRGGRVVKHFTLSPWTRALSHTLAAGEFHTDINTAPEPPVATVIQCLIPDPDAPTHGELRVAVLADLLRELRESGESRALQFLTEQPVTLVNETAPDGWTGVQVEGDEIRFHPESLRAAQHRLGTNPADQESCLEVIHRVALAVSTPIDLAVGDLLIVSNRRCLHRRGAATVRFRTFPRDFESRRVAVFHLLDEPTS